MWARRQLIITRDYQANLTEVVVALHVDPEKRQKPLRNSSNTYLRLKALMTKTQKIIK